MDGVSDTPPRWRSVSMRRALSRPILFPDPKLRAQHLCMGSLAGLGLHTCKPAPPYRGIRVHLSCPKPSSPCCGKNHKSRSPYWGRNHKSGLPCCGKKHRSRSPDCGRNHKYICKKRFFLYLSKYTINILYVLHIYYMFLIIFYFCADI